MDKNEHDRKCDEVVRAGIVGTPICLALAALVSVAWWLFDIPWRVGAPVVFALAVAGPVTIIAALWRDLIFNPRWR